MKNIHNARDLKNAIAELERKKKIDEEALKFEFKEVREIYKPANVVKNTVAEVAASPKFRHNLLNIAIGIGAGYLSRKAMVGKSAGLLKKTLGTAVQFGVASLIAKRESADEPQKKGSLLKRIFSRPKRQDF